MVYVTTPPKTESGVQYLKQQPKISHVGAEPPHDFSFLLQSSLECGYILL